MTFLSAEEVKKQHIEEMGEELGSIYNALWNEVASLYLYWGEYMELFGKKSRVELINEAAGGFFKMTQDVLHRDILLGIARITDPKSSGTDKDNLTIQKIPDLIDDESKKSRVSELVKAAVDKASFCRDWRNRHIAHRDLRLALDNPTAKSLEVSTAEKIDAVLLAFAKVLQTVSDAELIAFKDIVRPRGAESLLYVLADGLKKDKERKEKAMAGIWDPEDHKSEAL